MSLLERLFRRTQLTTSVEYTTHAGTYCLFEIPSMTGSMFQFVKKGEDAPSGAIPISGLPQGCQIEFSKEGVPFARKITQL